MNECAPLMSKCSKILLSSIAKTSCAMDPGVADVRQDVTISVVIEVSFNSSNPVRALVHSSPKSLWARFSDLANRGAVCKSFKIHNILLFDKLQSTIVYSWD